ncbi:MAG: hypothetical protein A2504_03525 [Bdellovibrionales bacterium RIFOXYD12_FULL_39_22]|nr:MAG: hypothetical protein A2385_11275 [Bdellovibrionales bacterium RIFOXYB1_FULL_39_21]OFZ41650.1 MAG: hypothetical protein A2485_01585 [Bdellovibrionales bacterium RIFOXYC12_FULL_39_17]OFZ46050.1 MAG: hypothetical protein A2404_11950 [Bdellovibrionales bacterium RIFOXYC1_FULL_39_130]OFZ71166.1 MAG: hypothetical protein A2451_02745 [Bdellovibrionales bacterium RIFOXYC2_FULL_39_8]OFZ74877.1 MAG: hypothetical protein A2560_14990 [Bdellovibrionales bacterium RIFOXYD1_FULL_39_84]OFZ92730.1 MAG:
MSLKNNRRRPEMPSEEVNITSLMDILTTLLFFILMISSFSNYSVIGGSALISGTPSTEEKKVFSLQIRVIDANKGSVELGPIEGLSIVGREQFAKYLNRFFQGSEVNGFSKSITGKDSTEFLKKLKTELVVIKKAFPQETKAILSISDNVKYQDAINGLSALRELASDDKGVELASTSGQKETVRYLFPEVIISENN